MFSNIEITPKFSVNHNKSQKLYFEPQLFTHQKNMSYKETFDKISSQNKVLQSNTGEMKLTYRKLAAFYHTVWRATESHQINENSSFSFNFNFQSMCPHQIFLLVLATI